MLVLDQWSQSLVQGSFWTKYTSVRGLDGICYLKQSFLTWKLLDWTSFWLPIHEMVQPSLHNGPLFYQKKLRLQFFQHIIRFTTILWNFFSKKVWKKLVLGCKIPSSFHISRTSSVLEENSKIECDTYILQ